MLRSALAAKLLAKITCVVLVATATLLAVCTALHFEASTAHNPAALSPFTTPLHAAPVSQSKGSKLAVTTEAATANASWFGMAAKYVAVKMAPKLSCAAAAMSRSQESVRPRNGCTCACSLAEESQKMR